MDIQTAFRHLAIAAGLGLLVGLQRERVNAGLAGLRTFPLITMFGSICAMLAASAGGWILAAGFIALASGRVPPVVVILGSASLGPFLT